MSRTHRVTSFNQPISLKPLKSLRAMFLLAFLALLGLAGNYFAFPIFFGVDFLFSTIAVLIVVRIYGIAWGMLVAIIASSFTFSIFVHPYNIIIFASEALFVGWLLRRRNENMIILDGVFWLLLGMPMGWLFYFGLMDMNISITLLITLKLSVNGIFNALIADLILTYLPICEWVEPPSAYSRGNKVTLQQIIFNLLVAFVLFPALVYMFTDNLRALEEMEKGIESHTAAVSTQINKQLITWQQLHLHAVVDLAKIAAQSPMQAKPDLQINTENITREYPDLVGMYIGDSAGTSIAFYPPNDANGVSVLGQTFADRAYYQEVKKTHRIGMSDVFIGRASVPYPIVVLTVPVLKDSGFRGYVAGVLDLSYISTLFKLYDQERDLDVTLLDRTDRVIASTRSGLRALQFYQRPNDVVTQYLGPDWYRLLPRLGANIHPAVRWQKAVYIREAKLSADIPWTLIIEYPYTHHFTKILDNTIKDLASILFIALLAFLFASRVSRQLVAPLSSLNALTTDLPGKLLDHQDLNWPDSQVAEISSLAGNFKTMAAILNINFKKLEQRSAAIKASLDGIAVLNENEKFIYVNRAQAKIYGYHSPKKLIGKSWQVLYDQEQISRFEAEIMPKFYEMGHWQGEATGKKLDGSKFPQEMSLSLITGGGSVCVVRDITARKQAEQAIWEEKERAQVTLHSIGDAVITTDATGKVEYLNPVAEELTGWTKEEAQGRPLSQIFTIVSEQTNLPLENPVERCLREGRSVGLENHTYLINRDKSLFAIEDSAAPIRDRQNMIIGAVLVFHDASEKHNMVRKLTHLAQHDALTNLPNRVLFKDRLNVELAHAQRNKEKLAVIFLDLDRFKLVNDTLGHAMGDELLKRVANRLSNCLRESDTVSRLGGDEFTILLPGLDQEEDVVKIAQKVIENLQQPCELGGHEFHITTSIGFALYPEDGEDAETLLKNADTAMYRAKEKGGNNYLRYTPADNFGTDDPKL